MKIYYPEIYYEKRESVAEKIGAVAKDFMTRFNRTKERLDNIQGFECAVALGAMLLIFIWGMLIPRWGSFKVAGMILTGIAVVCGILFFIAVVLKHLRKREYKRYEVLRERFISEKVRELVKYDDIANKIYPFYRAGIEEVSCAFDVSNGDLVFCPVSTYKTGAITGEIRFDLDKLNVSEEITKLISQADFRFADENYEKFDENEWMQYIAKLEEKDSY